MLRDHYTYLITTCVKILCNNYNPLVFFKVNYLIDEGQMTSKGSNAVISYLDHFLDEFGLGEPDVHFHCDNCSGQNKNK